MASPNETAQGLAGLLIIGTLGYCYCSSSGSPSAPSTPSVTEMRAEQARDRRVEEERDAADRDARVADLNRKICTNADLAQTTSQAIVRVRGNTAIVRDDILAEMNDEVATVLGTWTAICEAKSDYAYLAREDGVRIGKWSLESDYEPIVTASPGR